jgi:hypothetical protein
VSWCERWDIKINEAKTPAICYSHRRKPVETRPFVDHVKYPGVIFDKRDYTVTVYRKDRRQAPPPSLKM